MFEKIIITLILVLAAVLVFSGCTTADRIEDAVESKADAVEDMIESKFDPIEDAVENRLDSVEDAVENALAGNPPKAEPTTANAAAEELKAIRKQLTEAADAQGINQRQAEIRRSLNEAESRVRANQTVQSRPEPTRGILVGDTVELLKLGTKASVIAINKDGTYQLQAGILKLTAKAEEIYLLEQDNPYQQRGGRPAHSGREMKVTATSSEIDLRGMDSVEAICILERYLDEAMRSNLQSVRIIHGKGTGVLRAAVHQSLRKNKFVKKFRLGVYGEGEDGVTIAEFR